MAGGEGVGGEMGAKARKREDSKGKSTNGADGAKRRGPGKGGERVAREYRRDRGDREGWAWGTL